MTLEIREEDFQVVRCANCGHIVESKVKFCPECGSELGVAKPAPIVINQYIGTSGSVSTSTPTVQSQSGTDNTSAMLVHLSALAGYLIPFANIVVPLILWSVNKDKSAFVDANGKEAVNFQISVTLYIMVSGLLSVILIGLPILAGLLLFDLVVTIIAALRANNGEFYRYPLSIRFIR